MKKRQKPKRDVVLNQAAAKPEIGRRSIFAAWRSWLPGVLLVAMVAVAYLPAVRGGYVLDDDVYLTNNANLRSADGLGRIWFEIGAAPDYDTLVYSTFWLEYRLWGLAPLGYHAVNIVLHALSAVLLWRLLVRLRVPGGWLAAAIFAVHPVCVESVAWIAERKNTLSLLLGLAAMLCYLRFEPAEDLPAGAAAPRHRRGYYATALVLFALALLSKAQVVAMPVVLLVLYWWKRGTIGWRTVKPLLPFFLLGLLLAAVTVWIETVYNGAAGADYAATLWQRCLIAGRALWFYPSKLIWPQPLTFVYPRWEANAGQWWQNLFPFAAILAVAGLWMARRKISRGPLAAVLIFGGLLFPVLGFFNICYQRCSFVADHFQYHAAAALIALMTAAGCKFAERWKAESARKISGVAAATVLGIFMLLSWRQSQLYASGESLYRDTLLKNPDCWLAHNNLGNVLRQVGKLDEAIAEYQQALQLKENYPEALVNLGAALAEENHPEQAIEQYQQALEIKPNYAQAHDYLGAALAKTGQTQQAVDQYEEALRLNPNDGEVYNNWGTLLLEKGQKRAAIEHFATALEIDSDDAPAHCNLGSALEQLGQHRKAIEELRLALQLNPNLAEAHNMLGAALVATGRADQAIGQYRQAVQLKPNYTEAHFNLGLALMGAHQPQEAAGQFQAVLRESPHDLVCALNLAIAYAQADQHDQAIAAAQSAKEIAESTGQTTQAKEIQTWLSTYQASSAGREDVRAASYEAPTAR